MIFLEELTVWRNVSIVGAVNVSQLNIDRRNVAAAVPSRDGTAEDSGRYIRCRFAVAYVAI